MYCSTMTTLTTLLSTVGNVALENDVQCSWQAGFGPRAVVWPTLHYVALLGQWIGFFAYKQ